jgi:RNA polymerase sigma-70 factor (ECF subfamily)
MADSESMRLLGQWRAGDEQAAAELFRRYANQLVALARSHLSTKLSRRVDPEDVVQSAYRSFFAHARAGRYEVQRGGDLWRLLVGITFHKLSTQIKWNTSKKRSVQREEAFGSEDSLEGIAVQRLAQLPSPVEAAALADEVEQIMSALEPAQRRVFELRLQGHNIFEIAAATDVGERTVRRILSRVKHQLQQRYPSRITDERRGGRKA